jgi:hypothetical protein
MLPLHQRGLRGRGGGRTHKGLLSLGCFRDSCRQPIIGLPFLVDAIDAGWDGNFRLVRRALPPTACGTVATASSHFPAGAFVGADI